MNPDSVSRWLTLTANLGVVIGLVLLLVELRQNSDLVRAEIHQARSDAHVANIMQLADTEFLLPVVDKFITAGGFYDPSVLDQFASDELARIKQWARAYHQDYDNLFFQYQQGYLAEEFYRYRVEAAIILFAPVWKKLGTSEGGDRRPSFDAEIQRIMSENQ